MFINDLQTQLRYGVPMHILFLFGWLLLIAAFATAASEPFVMFTVSGRGITSSIVTSAYDLWYTLAPGHLVLSKIRIEAISPTLWDPILRSLLYLPAWLLFGMPGFILAWYCRPNRVMSVEVREEYERQKESLFVLEELNRAARKDETYHPREDDRSPVHELFDLDKSEDEDIRKAVTEQDHTIRDPSLDDLEAFTVDPSSLNIEDLYAEIDLLEASQNDETPPETKKE